MPRAFLVTLSVLLICGSTLGAERPLRVFFVGNSYTFVNDLPGVLAGLAEASRGRRIVTGQRTPGGYTLEQHVKTEACSTREDSLGKPQSNAFRDFSIFCVPCSGDPSEPRSRSCGTF